MSSLSGWLRMRKIRNYKPSTMPSRQLLSVIRSIKYINIVKWYTVEWYQAIQDSLPGW